MNHHIAVLSDVHANPFALQAVLDDAKRHEPQPAGYWNLGDWIGRGPDAVKTMKRLSRLYKKQTDTNRAAWLAGNHDLMVLGEISTLVLHQDSLADSTLGGMSRQAGILADQHRRELKENHQVMLDLLEELPTYAHSLPHVYMAHGQYYFAEDGKPDETRAHSTYLFLDNDIADMMQNLWQHLPAYDRPWLVLVGHTHQAGVWQWDSASGQVTKVHNGGNGNYTLHDLPTKPVCINPGSVGFPRKPEYPHPAYTIINLADDGSTLEIAMRTAPYRLNGYKFPENYPQNLIDRMQWSQNAQKQHKQTRGNQ